MQCFFRPFLNALAVVGDDFHNRRHADRIAHRAFRRRAYGRFGIADVEQIIARVFNLPRHGKVDLDNVFIAGQRNVFRAQITGKPPAPRIGGKADFNAVFARHVRRQNRFDGIRQMIVQSRRGRVGVFSETQNDALFLRLNLIEPRQHPQQSEHADNAPNAHGTESAAAVPVQRAADAFCIFFEQFFDFGGFAVFGTPRVLIVVVVAPRAFVVSHINLP